MSNPREIINIKQLLARRYDLLHLEAFSSLLGNVESRFTMMLYGPSGSGKSVFALKLAGYLANNHGKVLYNSHEERDNQTIQERCIQWNINAPRLYIGRALPFDRMMDKIDRNKYRFVIIDSIQYMDFSYEQLKELRARFSRRKLAVIMISFGASLNNPDRSRDHLHASDVKCFFKGGHLHVISRYLPAPVDHRLFIMSRSTQQTLF